VNRSISIKIMLKDVFKNSINTLLHCSSSPPNLWLLCIQNVVYILNRLSTKSLQVKISLEASTAQQANISGGKFFPFWIIIGMNLCTLSTKHLPVKLPLTLQNLKNGEEVLLALLSILALDSILSLFVAC
jgi:hypothetical protein